MLREMVSFFFLLLLLLLVCFVNVCCWMFFFFFHSSSFTFGVGVFCLFTSLGFLFKCVFIIVYIMVGLFCLSLF